MAYVPNPYPGSEVPGYLIYRLPYLTNEYFVNSMNLAEASARQDADVMLTGVWWDKK